MPELEHSFVLPEFQPMLEDAGYEERLRGLAHRIISRPTAMSNIRRTNNLLRRTFDLARPSTIDWLPEVEDVMDSGYFRGTHGWHLDYSSIDNNISLVASTAPTEFAEADVLFKEALLDTEFWIFDLPIEDVDHYSNVGFIGQVVRYLSEHYGRNWLEVAAGFEPPNQKQDVLGDLVEVKNNSLTIVQSMPWTVATGRNSTTLHRSAPWHHSQPKRRAFGRA